MILDELAGQREILRFLASAFLAESAKEKTDIQEHDYDVIKGTKGLLLNRKCAIAIRLVAALHLNTDSSC